MSSTRRLALHASALSVVEYELYTSSLRDLAVGDEEPGRGGNSGGADEEEDDVFFEKMKIGVREARAWLRGRYSDLSAGVIDKILRLFCPNLGPGDLLSGSEFFAALRLVIHAENGAEVERSLAFVQANPTKSILQFSSTSRVTTSSRPMVETNPTQSSSFSRVTPSSRPMIETRAIPSTSRTSSLSPTKRSGELPPPPPHHPNSVSSTSPVPPPMPSRRPHPQTESVLSASTRSSKSNSNTVDQHPSSSSSHNPFSQSEHNYTSAPSSHVRPQPPLHPSQRSDTSKSLVSVVVASSSSTTQHSAHNPFVHRPPQPRSEDGSKLPPLPPRKPPPPVPLVQPPQHISTRNRGDRSISPSKHPHPPPVPPVAAKPTHHVTSNLIKQSLQASKVAQSMKRAEEQLEKERVMQVLKSSSVSGTHAHNQGQNQMGLGSRSLGGGGGSMSPERRVYASSEGVVSASSSSESGAPPLPQRRKQYQYAQYPPEEERHRYQQQQQPSPPLSASSMEQVALASVPPASQTRRNYARANTDPFAVSPFRSPVDPVSPPSISTSSVGVDSPEPSPSRSSFGDPPPPTHPDRMKAYVPYQPLHHHHPSASTATTAGAPHQDDGDSAGRGSFDDIYGTNSVEPTPTPSPSKPQPRVFRSRSMHQTSPTQMQGQGQGEGHMQTQMLPPPVRRKRPESVQVLKSVDREALMSSLSRGGEGTGMGTGLGLDNSIGIGRRPGGSTTPHRRSSLSVSMTPTSMSNSTTSSNGGGHGGGLGGGYGYRYADSPLSNFQRTIATTLQPKLDKARYKAEAGLTKRGFVRDPHGRGVKGEEEEGLMAGESQGGIGGNEGTVRGRKMVGGSSASGVGKTGWVGTPRRMSMRAGDDEGGGGGMEGESGLFDDPEVDEDEDWSRSRGMGMGMDGGTSVDGNGGGDGNVFDDVRSIEKDNLKWPAGEGWKPL